MSEDNLKDKIEFVEKMKQENPRAFDFLSGSATRTDLIEYWCNPPKEDNNCPMDYYGPDGWIRSGYLVKYLSRHIEKDAHILEVGSGVGRNLAVLRFARFSNLAGIEVSENAIRTMRTMIPLLDDSIIYHGPVEEWIYRMGSDSFDLIFTMAVFEHLPPQSEHVFEQVVRCMRTYLLTVEDESGVGPRHFPRNYQQVFDKFGLKQIDFEKNLVGLPKGFRLRLFRKEAKT